MKKIYFVAAIIAVATVACSKNEQPGQDSTNRIESFTMSMPDMQNGTETKTGLILAGGKYNKLVWKEYDELVVTTQEELNAKGGNEFYYNTYYTTSNNVDVADFQYKSQTGGDFATGTNYAVFYTLGSNPRRHVTFMAVEVPPTQSYAENSIQSGRMPMLGYGPDLKSMSMKCLANIVRLQFYSTEDNVTITSITLESTVTGSGTDNGKYAIAGPIALDKSKLASYVADPTTTSLWSIDSIISSSINYNCTGSDPLADNAGAATAFNIVISDNNKDVKDEFDNEPYQIRATINWKKAGVAQTARVKILASLTAEQRSKTGTVFTFPAVDISNDSAGWD